MLVESIGSLIKLKKRSGIKKRNKTKYHQTSVLMFHFCNRMFLNELRVGTK